MMIHWAVDPVVHEFDQRSKGSKKERLMASKSPVVTPHKRDGTWCEWTKDRGYWKGYQCSNNADFIVEGRGAFCVVHCAMALDDERFAKNKTVKRPKA